MKCWAERIAMYGNGNILKGRDLKGGWWMRVHAGVLDNEMVWKG